MGRKRKIKQTSPSGIACSSFSSVPLLCNTLLKRTGCELWCPLKEERLWTWIWAYFFIVVTPHEWEEHLTSLFVRSLELWNVDNLVHLQIFLSFGFCLKDLSKADYLEIEFPNAHCVLLTQKFPDISREGKLILRIHSLQSSFIWGRESWPETLHFFQSKHSASRGILVQDGVWRVDYRRWSYHPLQGTNFIFYTSNRGLPLSCKYIIAK